jgi:hypothetical protein
MVALALVAAGCSKKATPSSGGSGGSGGSAFSIAAPATGASVSEPFAVKVNSSAPLGDPSTGDDHVHLCFDGADCSVDYKIMYSDSFQITDLPSGQHTITASLRNADHSPVGPTATITVTVTGGGASSSATSSPTSSGGYYH